MLTPHKQLAALQTAGSWTQLMAEQESMKMMPVGAVWEEFCRREGVPSEDAWFGDVMRYEKDVLRFR